MPIKVPVRSTAAPSTSSATPSGPKTPFVLCPAGPQLAVCCDVVDLGIENTPWQGVNRDVHKCRLKWQSHYTLPATGEPFLVQKKYTLSLGPKSNLRKDIDAWRKNPLTDKELADFDLEILIGKMCYLNVKHTTRNGKRYADVVSLMPPPPNSPKLVIRNYVRDVVRRQADEEAKAAAAARQQAVEAQAPETYVDEPPPGEWDSVDDPNDDF